METTGDSLTVCTDPTATVTLTSPNATSSELTLNEQGCWTGTALAAGNYSAAAIDTCGETSQTAIVAPAAADTEAAHPAAKAAGILPFIAPFIGSETLMRYETSWDMDMRDASGIVGLRGGVKVPLGNDFSLVPALGIQHRTSVNEGNVYPDEGVNIDLGVEKYLTENFFIGAGVGLWDVDDSDYREESVFINIGGGLSESLEWFAEARGIDSENVDGHDGFGDNKAYNAGVRFLF